MSFVGQSQEPTLIGDNTIEKGFNNGIDGGCQSMTPLEQEIFPIDERNMTNGKMISDVNETKMSTTR
jgi:hypothetical protein